MATPCRAVLGLLAGALLVAADVEARVKLITLPARERVEIQLDHPDATLVEEERRVPLRAGANQVDFSWANTAIVPDSIVFRVLEDGGAGAPPAVISVSYPPGEQALVWNVHARRSGAWRVRISYLLRDLARDFHYRAVVDREERRLDLRQYLRVRNTANESFGASGIWVGHGERRVQPVGIDETREILLARHRGVPVVKTWTVDAAGLGWLDRARDELRVAMHYRIANRAPASAPEAARTGRLGAAPLPAGKVRIFQLDGRGGRAFLGEDWGGYTSPGEEMALYLGLARDVTVTRRVERSHRDRVAGNLFHQDVVVVYELENFKPEGVTLRVVEDVHALRGEVIGNRGGGVGRMPAWRLGGRTTFTGGVDVQASDQRRVVHTVELPPADADGHARKEVRKLHLVLENEW